MANTPGSAFASVVVENAAADDRGAPEVFIRYFLDGTKHRPAARGG